MEKKPITEISIYPGKKEHINDIVDFQIAMAKETEGLDLKRGMVRKGVARLIDLPYYGHYYLAYEAGNAEAGPIGCLLITPEWSDWNNMEYYWLQSVYVKPEYRGRGVFKQMVQCIEKRVTYKDVKAIRLYVDKGNETAKKCYKKLGLKPCHYSMYEKVLK